MLTLDEIRAALQMRVLTTVSRHTGVNRTTLHNIKNGSETNPTLKTMQALSNYLAPEYKGKP